MIFNEIYGCYFKAVGRILEEAVKGRLTEEHMKKIIDENAFGESFLTIIPALKSQQWQLITEEFKTPIKHPPTIPLSTIEKRWLKAITLDPRIKLFNIDIPELRSVEPLFTTSDYVVFDKYNNGDDFLDEGYIKNFRNILRAIKEKRRLRISYISSKGREMSFLCIPCGFEYSEKDDRFRLKTLGCPYVDVINLCNIKECKLEGYFTNKPLPVKTPQKKTLTMELFDGRNALERAMLHFAHFDKEAEKLNNNRYRIRLSYLEGDETEIVIRILSFGPMIKVIEPESFVALIKERLRMQKGCEFL